jgi:hypothetical protein
VKSNDKRVKLDKIIICRGKGIIVGVEKKISTKYGPLME